MFKSKTSDPLISTGGMNRDQFNLHKLILIISKNGNIYGIDSISSDIIWKRRVPKLNQCSMQTLTVSDTNIHEGKVNPQTHKKRRVTFGHFIQYLEKVLRIFFNIVNLLVVFFS